IAGIASNDCEILNKSGSGDQAILDGHCIARRTQVGQQLSPAEPRRRIPRQTRELRDALFEPLFQSLAAFAGRKEMNTKPNFAENDRVDSKLNLVLSEPLDHFLGRRCFGSLAQYIGVDQVFHRESVDSDSMGTKKPFSGQASSQST